MLLLDKSSEELASDMRERRLPLEIAIVLIEGDGISELVQGCDDLLVLFSLVDAETGRRVSVADDLKG